MYWRLLCLFALLPLSLAAQQPAVTLVITKDSITKSPHALKQLKTWRFCKKDSMAFADKGFNDSSWSAISSRPRVDSELATGQGYRSRTDWYRLHFYADTSVAGVPLAVEMDASGAAEIYLDGEKLHAYGVIKPNGNSSFAHIEHTPFIMVVKSAGEHVLAVRFANYVTRSILKDEEDCVTGFRMGLTSVDNVFMNENGAVLSNVILYVFIITVFLVLAAVHMLLFLYYRAVWSNLYFSFFCFSFCAIVFSLYLKSNGDDPSFIEWYGSWVAPIAIAVALFSFSGLNNMLFGRRKLLFRVITVMSIACVAVNLLNADWGSTAYIITAGVVLIEAAVLPVLGIYRKIRGARIVGFGVMFFAMFSLAIFAWLLVKHGINFAPDSKAGILFFVLGIAAVLSIPFSMSVYLSWSFAATNRELKRNLQQVEQLNRQTLEQELEKKRIIEGQKEQLEVEVAARTSQVTTQKEEIERQHEELKTEKQKSDELLLNILPSEVAEELKQKGFSEAKYFDDVTVLFTDFVNFTNAGEILAPQELVSELDVCFKAFDEIISKYKLEKIKTIGDAYLAVCGLPQPQPDHAVRTVAAAMEIRDFMTARRQQLGDRIFEIRIGIHSGSVVAGIVGLIKFAYDIWGDTVNTAARIEQNSQPGKVNISQPAYDLVKNDFICSPRGQIVAKNKGELNMYFVEGAKLIVA